MFIGVLGSLGSRSWSQTFPNGIQHSQRSCKGPVLPWPSKLLAAIDSLRLSGPRGGEGNSDTDSPSCFFWSVLFMTLSLATASHPGLQWFQSSIQLRTTGSSAKWAPSRGSWPFCLRWCMVLICMATWKIPLAPKWWVPSLTSSKLCWILQFSRHFQSPGVQEEIVSFLIFVLCRLPDTTSNFPTPGSRHLLHFYTSHGYIASI